jgi:hypothetical protein
LFKQNNLNKSAAGSSFIKADNGKKLAQSGALFPLMNMDNVDADEIITNSRLRESEKAGGKTIGDGDGHNTDSTIPSDTAKNRNSQTR